MKMFLLLCVFYGFLKATGYNKYPNPSLKSNFTTAKEFKKICLDHNEQAATTFHDLYTNCYESVMQCMPNSNQLILETAAFQTANFLIKSRLEQLSIGMDIEYSQATKQLDRNLSKMISLILKRDIMLCGTFSQSFLTNKYRPNYFKKKVFYKKRDLKLNK
ncbi:hypothetical protein EDEG_02307 [Edhazardia aedis USNM 41457]|uniref:Uncharacterized protein n=1 Tax=Edhazardia aedis (strain USNM 41457) TaxID=1003232 RepID=J9DL79_EDHAE|nr:hypothetical protein EDEG_02307 [Edhazardia aedis USNM 41457]|eukprot:EJW03350.1 hypothetical protein EDEG_02307 [Edhazardia aedis USNM 41457]